MSLPTLRRKDVPWPGETPVAGCFTPIGRLKSACNLRSHKGLWTYIYIYGIDGTVVSTKAHLCRGGFHITCVEVSDSWVYE